VGKKRKEAEKWKRDKMMLSIKYWVFKARLAKKLVNQYVGPYIIDVRCGLHLVIQDLIKVSQKSKWVIYALSKNTEVEVRITFDFSLCAVLL